MKRAAPSVTRRELLAGASALSASALAGCSERLWSRAENTAPDQVELTIKTVPADDDSIAAKVMSLLRENFQEAGIDATHEPIAEAELHRDVLIEGDYDVFVLEHQGLDEYDALHGLLHSQFVSERGWQNPFHFSDVTADDHLETQRTTAGTERSDQLNELFGHLEETAPYTVVAYPDRIGGTRQQIEVAHPPRRAIDYIDVLSSEPTDGPRDAPLEVGAYGEGLTERLNPLVVDRNRIHGLMELLYDPLVRQPSSVEESIDSGATNDSNDNNSTNDSNDTDDSDSTDNDDSDEFIPWLAEDISWHDTGQLSATISLRSDLSWHDGEPLDAEDVAFTMRFLRDTSLGAVEGGVPAPRYRDRQTVVDNVDAIDVVDEQTVEIPFGSATQPAATRLLAVPILPQHVWEPRSEVVADRQTEALVDDNEEPVGSGLFEFVEAAMDELVLEPFDDHVFRESTSDRPDVLEDFSQFEGMRYRIDPNVGAMLDALLEGEIDVTASRIPPGEIDTIADSDSVTTVTTATDSFYMVGYNMHHPELGNPYFRRILSQLIDRDHVVTEFFDGFAESPTTNSSLLGLRDGLETTETESALSQFPGSDGEIDVDRVRRMFEEEGYRYEDGVLLE